ncbi:hypothetical protein Patl1_05279 [Pistacia atlantica]|uniref:Uncharacterized protein n=1 Tax=Pistacia atlantica TaxID=434234 RepID=A0ACC1BVP2_9ROSI|nr:hypothetical protein Patl1_05279 [Pistacia atlantica]
MGHCCSKNVSVVNNDSVTSVDQSKPPPTTADSTSFAASPFPSPLPAGVAPSPSPGRTPGRKFKWPLPPPSPAKPIMSAIMKRRASKEKPVTAEEGERRLDKNFGYGKNFGSKFELGKEVGRGHFGHTCWAKGKKGALKGQSLAVKIISKAKMTTAISVEDVRREVKILKALSSHKNMIKFHEAFEDAINVYIVMEGGRYTEEDAKKIIVQILSVVAFCHLQGVVHRDLKPENFLFTTRDEDAPLKVIDFGLSDFVKPGNNHLSSVLYFKL